MKPRVMAGEFSALFPAFLRIIPSATGLDFARHLARVHGFVILPRHRPVRLADRRDRLAVMLFCPQCPFARGGSSYNGGFSFGRNSVPGLPRGLANFS